jgi:hypothetical protein
MIIQIAIATASLIGVLCIGWYQLVNHRYKEFQLNVKKGDPCIVFIGEERMNAKILKLGGIFVEVLTVYGKSKVLRDEILPILGYNYKKR